MTPSRSGCARLPPRAGKITRNAIHRDAPFIFLTIICAAPCQPCSSAPIPPLHSSVLKLDRKNHSVAGECCAGENGLGFPQKLLEVELGVTGTVMYQGEFFYASGGGRYTRGFLGGHVLFGMGVRRKLPLEHSLADKKV